MWGDVRRIIQKFDKLHIHSTYIQLPFFSFYDYSKYVETTSISSIVKDGRLRAGSKLFLYCSEEDGGRRRIKVGKKSKSTTAFTTNRCHQPSCPPARPPDRQTVLSHLVSSLISRAVSTFNIINPIISSTVANLSLPEKEKGETRIGESERK